jgi:nitrogen fixation protein FixH
MTTSRHLEMAGQQRERSWWYPYIFVAAFAVVVAVNGVMIWIAVTTFPGLATDKSYDRGLKYNQNLAAAQAQAEMGWQVEIAAAKQSSGLVRVEGFYKDKNAAPINELAVKAYLIRPAVTGHDRDIELSPQGEGRYAGALELPLAGLWEVRLIASGKGLHHQMEQRIDLR